MANKRIDQLVTSDPFKPGDFLIVWSDNRTEKQTIAQLTEYLQENLVFSGGTDLSSDPLFLSLSGDVTNIQEQIITGGTYNEITGTITLYQYNGSTIDITGITSSYFANSLSGLTDTNITSPQNGDRLIYKNGSWLNLSKVNMYFTPNYQGQTYFTNILLTEPSFPEKAEFWVNGVKQRYGITFDFVLSGSTYRDLVWITNKHPLGPNDELNIKYF
jgi:hypothetical protein